MVHDAGLTGREEPLQALTLLYNYLNFHVDTPLSPAEMMLKISRDDDDELDRMEFSDGLKDCGLRLDLFKQLSNALHNLDVTDGRAVFGEVHIPSSVVSMIHPHW